MKRAVTLLVCFSTIGYVGVCGYLYVMQRKLLYHPAETYHSPSGLPKMQEVTLHTTDGFTLRSWYQPAKKHHPTVLFLHGNTGGLTERIAYYRTIIEHGYGVFALDYRGYSGNGGTPTEAGLYTDARTAMAYLLTHDTPPSTIIAMGHSLGTGVAVQIATEYPLHSLVLLAPFTSMVDVASERYPYIPVSLLLRDRYDSLSKASNVQEPVWIFHGTADEVIPSVHSKQLYDAMISDKHLTYMKDVDHNGIEMKKVMEVLKEEQMPSPSNILRAN
jgi:uncharacterized protein